MSLSRRQITRSPSRPVAACIAGQRCQRIWDQSRESRLAAYDLIIFDEGTDFLESQYRFIIGGTARQTRSSDPE